MTYDPYILTPHDRTIEPHYASIIL